jgi:ubiquinone/menaquinone biosynthesis C-methylase UbiE/glycosyltransferase involved in cell wall biosynthesis
MQSLNMDLVYDQIRRTSSVASVLDVGCGEGYLVYKLLENGADAYGIDLAPAVTQQAAAWAPGRFVQGDASNLPFGDNAFDTVVTTRVLDSISSEDLPAVLAEIRRVARRFVFAIVASGSRSREAWDRVFLDRGFSRHPLIQTLVPFGVPENEQSLILAYEKIPSATLARYPLSQLKLERDLHMDMLREPGVRSDAHIARYQLAASYVRTGDVVVDAACGLGYGSALLADASLASRIIGIDESESAIEYAGAVFGPLRPQLEFRRGDVLDLRQFPTASVDLVVSFETLEHIAEPEKFLAEIARVLTPGGRLIGSVPNLWVDETGNDPNPYHLHVYDCDKLTEQCREYLKMEQLYQQNAEQETEQGREAASLFEIDADGKNTQGKPEWILIVAAKDPQSGTHVEYRETVYAESGHEPSNVTAYARDYANPWLVRSLVNISSRFRSSELLKEMAADVQAAEGLRTADYGAALCIEGYQLIRTTSAGFKMVDAYLSRAEAYLAQDADSAHAYRWHLSIQFLIGKIQMLVGRRRDAKETFRALSERDALRFSPLLGTKTIGAAFYSGWLSALDGDMDSATRAWQHGVTETHRLLQGDWRDIWASPSNPLPFGLLEVGDVADVGSRCALALKYADRLSRQPALFWKLIEDHSKTLQNESSRFRSLERTPVGARPVDGSAASLGAMRAMNAGRPLFVWGAGSLGRQLASNLIDVGVTPAGFIDSNSNKAGTLVMDLPVTGPEIVSADTTVRPFVVIGSMHVDSIREALVESGLREGVDFVAMLDFAILKEVKALYDASIRLASSQKAKAPRCLMYYPWNLDERSGALALFLSYSKALKQAGYRLDCYAARSAPNSLNSSSGGLYYGVFENVFSPPDGDSPVTRHLESIGGMCEDPGLPEKIGRDEASMVAAGVLAAIANYDVIGIQYTRCHSLKKMLPPGMPVVLFTHDLDSLVRRQSEFIEGAPAEYALEDEAARLKPFDLVTVVGPSDRQALHAVAPDLPIVEAPFTLCEEDVAVVREESPGVLLWVSSAAPFHRLSFQWFWQWVWPTIRAARPECRLLIAGRLSEVAEELGAGADAQVSIRGVVDDLNELYCQADVLVAPYYYGLGIKTKVVEAFAKGIPVVTTTLGIHNTHVLPGREALVADDADAYANHVIELVSCPARRAELVRNGREYLRRHHHPGQSLKDFVTSFDEVRRKKKASSKARAGAVRELSEPLRHLVPWVIQRCHGDGVRSVVLYGAGSHTRLLIPIWRAMGGLPIRKIVVSGSVTEPTCLGIPVVSAADFEPSHDQGIVLSSQGFEHAMAVSCRDRWPQSKVYPIWKPLHQAQPATEFETSCQAKIPTELYELEGSYEHTASLPV